jgi:chemotaxis signal transduction protein
MGDVIASESKSFTPGLECVVAQERLVIPSAAVQQIIEYEVSSLPLASDQIGGFGVHAGQVVISLRLCGWGPPARGCRRAKGVLLAVADRSSRWVVEVSEVVAFVDAAPESKRKSHRWSSSAVTRDGRSVSWLDVEAMLRELVATGLERQWT